MKQTRGLLEGFWEILRNSGVKTRVRFKLNLENNKFEFVIPRNAE
jgi:hypothetical protein